MTDDLPSPAEDHAHARARLRDDQHAWRALTGALLDVDTAARPGSTADDVEWALREVRVLVLDGRADLPALVGLALRGAYGS